MSSVATHRVCMVMPSSELTFDSSKTVWPPLGLLSVAGALREAGHEVSVVDGILEGWDCDIPLSDDSFLMGLPPRLLAERILENDPDVVGFSILFVNQLECAQATARLLKERKPEVFLLWGGPLITLNPQRYARLPEVDGVILGDADVVAPGLLAALAKDGRDCVLPPGAGLRSDGEFRLNEDYIGVENLDTLPMPARDLIDMPAYMARVAEHKVLPRQMPATTMITARGCPRKCSFCAAVTIYKRRYKTRSPEHVIAEIDHLVETYGVREILILDENFAINRKRIDRLLDLMIERDYGITWHCAAGIEVLTLTEEIVEKMARAGLYKLKISFESGNERVLNEVIEKPIDLAHGERIIQKAKDVGLAVGANFIIGFPWETRSEIFDSYAYAKKLDLDFVLWNLAQPHDNTPMTKRAIKEGLLPDDFAFEDIKPGKPYFKPAEVSVEELAAWRYEWWRELNFEGTGKQERYDRFWRPNPDWRPPPRPDGSVDAKPMQDINMT